MLDWWYITCLINNISFTNELPEDFINDAEITSLINEHRHIIFGNHQSNERINKEWVEKKIEDFSKTFAHAFKNSFQRTADEKIQYSSHC